MSPISRSCVLFVSSILLLAEASNSPIAWVWLLLPCILFLFGGLYSQPWLASLSLYLAVCCFGLLCKSRYDYASVLRDRLIRILNQSEGRSNCLIKNVAKTNRGWRLECKVLRFQSIELSSLDLSCLLYTPRTLTDLKKSDTLFGHINYKKIKENTNPLQFEKKTYYNAKGIYYEAYISDTDTLSYKHYYSSADHPIASMRSKIVDTIKDLELNSRSKAFIHALILGDKTKMESSTRESFVNSGCIHVLAVSGLHTGIVFSLFSPLLYLFRLKHSMRWLSFVIVSSLLFIFVSLCAYPPSAVRASFMLSFWLLTKCIGISKNAISILALTAFIVLMIEPVHILQLGFKLSYLALLGIIVFYKRMPFMENKYMQSPWASPVRMIWLSISAQLFIVPILLTEMSSFSTYFAISSMLAVPSIFIIMLISIISLISHNAIPLINNILDSLISFLTNTIGSIEKWPLSTVNEIYFTHLAFAISSSLIVLSAIALSYKNKSILVLASCIFFTILPCLQAQRLKQILSAQITIFSKNLGSLVALHYQGQEYILHERGRSNKEYLLSKLRTEHSIQTCHKLPIELPFLFKLNECTLMITGPENQICDLQNLPKHVDFLLPIQANAKSVKDIIDCIKFEMVIIDGSTIYDKRNSIIQTLHRHKISFHDTSIKGSWNYKF